jgi:anti-sigma regulatory factor (Ser/Thr protein kinase)
VAVHAAGVLQGGSTREWSWTLPFELPSARAVRGRVAVLLSGHGVRGELVDDACAVMSELVGNALRHARPRANGRLEVTVGIDAGSVYLSVADGGAGTVPSVVSPTPLARSGRGLGIVHSLTSDWGVKETADGNTVFGILDRA